MERSNGLNSLKIEGELASGKYSFEDLYEGASHPFEKNELARAQKSIRISQSNST